MTLSRVNLYLPMSLSRDLNKSDFDFDPGKLWLRRSLEVGSAHATVINHKVNAMHVQESFP